MRFPVCNLLLDPLDPLIFFLVNQGAGRGNL